VQRSIRRAQARRLAKERRRLGLAAAGAISATALLAPVAHATDFTVATRNDGPAAACAGANCANLRDAVNAANTTAGDDTVSFQPAAVPGPVVLTQGEIPVTATDKLTINGPGKDLISVSGDKDGSGTPTAGDSRIFNVTGTGAFSISGLTLTRGDAIAASGGAIVSAMNTKVALTDSAVTNSTAANGSGGGGIFAGGGLTLTGTTLTGNTAAAGPGGAVNYSPNTNAGGLKISGSTISGNHAVSGGGVRTYRPAAIDATTISGNQATGGSGGGISSGAALALTGSTISGNSATSDGGGIRSGDYSSLRVSNSTISGNTAPSGGGLGVTGSKYGYLNQVTDSTITGNHSTANGAGVFVRKLTDGERLVFTRSTISGNEGGAGFGGGVGFAGTAGGAIKGEFDLVDSTISGNTAAKGGGVSAGGASEGQLLGPDGVIDFANSTIAGNSASAAGGGLYLGQYDSGSPTVKKSATIKLTSTIVADNSAAGAAQDLDRVDTSTGGGFDLAFSLVEKPGDAPLLQRPGASIIGVDPQLGALAANGGSTQTQVPSNGSPVVDKGNSPARLDVDQRGHDRIVDINVPNTPRGDGTDIGAVEVDHPTPIPPPPSPVAKDKKPSATIKENHLGAKKRAPAVSGTAGDDHKVAKVQVALVLKVRGRCRDLLSSGGFSDPRRCSKPPKFHDAKGTSKWRFKLSARLDPGKYTVFARAIDNAGQKQSGFTKKNRVAFSVKE
jgi:hypothetical protein